MTDTSSNKPLENKTFEVTPQLLCKVKEELITVFDSHRQSPPAEDTFIIPVGNSPEELDHYVNFIAHLVVIYNYLKTLIPSSDGVSTQGTVLRAYQRLPFGKADLSVTELTRPAVIYFYLICIEQAEVLNEDQVHLLRAILEKSTSKDGIEEVLTIMSEKIAICDSLVHCIENGFFHPQLIRVAARIEMLQGTDIFTNALSPAYNLMANRRNFINFADGSGPHTPDGDQSL